SLELLEFVKRLAAYLFLRRRAAQAHEIARLVQLPHHRPREHGVSDQRTAAHDGIRGQNGDARPIEREVGRRARRVGLDEHAYVTWAGGRRGRHEHDGNDRKAFHVGIPPARKVRTRHAAVNLEIASEAVGSLVSPPGLNYRLSISILTIFDKSVIVTQ